MNGPEMRRENAILRPVFISTAGPLTAVKKLLILDLDETLVHSTEGASDIFSDFTIGNLTIVKRPHLDEFVRFALEKFEVAVWSQATHRYASAVVRNIFGDAGQLAFVWGGNRCTFCCNPAMRSYYYVKDLRKVRRRGYSLERVIMVDDTARKLERNYGNLVRIRPFHGDLEDRELLFLRDYLELLDREENVRVVEKRYWRERPPA